MVRKAATITVTDGEILGIRSSAISPWPPG